MRRNRTKKITQLALIVAFALMLSFVESRIPSPGIPGVKLGLANIAVIFALYKLGIKEAVVISLTRVLLMSMYFGFGMNTFYSVAGAVLSLSVMALLKKLTPLKEVAVSVTGGVMHNAGQLILAMFVFDSADVYYYMPFLALSGTLAGIAIGVASAILVKRVKMQ